MDSIAGIDVSKDCLDTAVTASGSAFQVANTHAGIDALASRLKAEGIAVVALEATGGFERLAVAGLSAAGFSVVNPAQVRAYANGLGRRAKTDPIDAAVIAAFVAATKPDIRPLRDEDTLTLSQLVDRRRQIVQMIVAKRPLAHGVGRQGPEEHEAAACRPASRARQPGRRPRRSYPQVAGLAGA